MLWYLARRLLYFIPTLLLIMLLTFFISRNTPGDPVEQHLQTKLASGSRSTLDYWQAYEKQREEMGIHLPVFYFTFTRMAVPATLHQVAIPAQRDMLQTLLWEYGNWPEIKRYYRALLRLYKLAISENSGTSAALKHSYELLNTKDIDEIHQQMAALKTVTAPRLEKAHQSVGHAFDRMEARATPWKNYLPAFHWNGGANQFHQWLFGSGNAQGGLVRGDLGQSYRTQRPVASQLGEAIGITIQLTVIALLLALLIAIPLGVFSAAHKDQPLDQGISTSLFLLHSLPAFWIGTLLIIFLGGGDFLQWFPPYGLGNIEGRTFWQALQVRISHLAMPIFCLVYPVLAYLSRQARGGVVSALHQPYITTARAKGLPGRSVVWRHGFRNALLPIITLLGNILPFAIGGSVIVEVVFSIPGMGKVSLDALYARDYPVVFGAVLITAVFTMLGYLLADVLYALADPRVNFRKRAI